MKTYRILFLFNFYFCLQAATDKNPKYIGPASGAFELDHITFHENLDSFFSKMNTSDLIRIVGKDSYFDTIQKKQTWTDTLNIFIEFRMPKQLIYILLKSSKSKIR